jgi:tetratricopeptide (TPR) repeat protein
MIRCLILFVLTVTVHICTPPELLCRAAQDQMSADAYYQKGVQHFNAGQFDEAVAAYQQAVKLRPDWVFTHSGLALSLLRLKRFAESAEAFKQATKLDPKYVPGYNGLGDAYYGLEKYEESVASYTEAARLDPNNPAAYAKLGRTTLS